MSPTDYLYQLFNLTNKTAIVIGGTGELGKTICKTLAGAGAHVIVLGRNEEAGKQCVDEIESKEGSAVFLPFDVTNENDFKSVVSELRSQNREADILVNGAGINSATPFLEITDEEWDRILIVNLRAVRLGCQIFGAYMLEQKTAGSIINIASLTSIKPLSRVFTYSATKAAVLNLTENLAREWATSNIRVNAISPGFFPAKQNQKVLTEDRIASIFTHTPMNRFGKPEELSGAILLMASNTAGSFLTGANIVVDGGFMAMTI